jgi:cytochrome c-type biogenesis protein CcmH/NrfF
VIDIAVVAALSYSSFTSLQLGTWGNDSAWLRGIAEFAILTAYAYLRAMGRKSLVWLAFGYVGGIGSALLIVNELYKRLKIEWEGPELYAVFVVASIFLGNFFLKKLREVKSVDIVYGIPLAVLTIPMITYGLVSQWGASDGFIRVSVGLLLLTAYAYWRTNTTKNVVWLVAGYSLGGLSAAALDDGIRRFWVTGYHGPEIFSLLFASSIFIGHKFLREVRKTESTLVLWGLPATAVLLPSALYTATTSGVNFTELSAEQITRAVAVLIVSGLSVLAGLRAGNRGLAYSGVLGLAIITWVHAALVVPDAVVEFRSIVIGAVLMTALTSLKNAGKLRGNSIVWLGIPIAVAMIPAIFNSLAALANPELSTVDWWRFGIVVTASAVMLIAGSLREIAGMFFPGLVGVVLAALPYGFKRVQQESWFLWVLLLIIAGIMVWIAVRMDQLRKQGKSSTTWLKELK